MPVWLPQGALQGTGKESNSSIHIAWIGKPLPIKVYLVKTRCFRVNDEKILKHIVEILYRVIELSISKATP